MNENVKYYTCSAVTKNAVSCIDRLDFKASTMYNSGKLSVNAFIF